MQVSEADAAAQPAREVEQQQQLQEHRATQTTPPLTSYEVNALLYNYLQETGLSHSAFAIRQESALDTAVSSNGSRLLDLQVPQHHLIRLLHKGLLYVEAEARWRGEDTQQRPPRLLGYDIQDHLPITRLIQSTSLPEVHPPEPFQVPTTTSSLTSGFRKPESPETSYQSIEPPSTGPSISTAESSRLAALNGSKSPPQSHALLNGDASASIVPKQRSTSQSQRISENGSTSPDISRRPSSSHSKGPQASTDHATSLQLDLPPLSSGNNNNEYSLKRKERDASDALARKNSQSMDVDPPAQESEHSTEKKSASAREDRFESSSASTTQARDKKRPKLDPASFPPPPTTASFQSSISAKAEAASPSVSTTTPLKSPAPLATPSASVPPVSVVTVRTVQTAKPQQHQTSAHPGTSHSGANGRRRSTSPSVSTKLPSQKERPDSSNNSRATSPEHQRKRPSSASAPAAGNGPHKKNAARAKATTANGLQHQKSRDHSPASTGKAEQMAPEPLRKGRGKSPTRGEVLARDSITLKGHSQCVTPCNWNPKVATKLATGAADATARVWAVPLAGEHTDDETSVVKHVNGNKKFEIGVVSWNPDGTLLATGAEDGIVRIWTPAGELCLVLSMHQRAINSIKWHKSGTMLLSASLDSSVCLWELSTGRVRQQFETHTESVLDCEWFDEQYFASCSMDKSIHLCSISRPNALHRLRGHQDEVNTVRFDPTRTMLATCSDDRTVRVWSMKSYFPHAPSLSGRKDQAIDENGGVFVLTGHTDDVHTVAWDPLSGSDGRPRILASGSFDSTARVWDADRGQCLYVLDRCIDIVYSLSFTPWDGKYLALGSNDGRVCVYRVKDGELLYEYKHTGPVYEAQWHPTLSYVAVTGFSPDVRVVPFQLEDDSKSGVVSGSTSDNKPEADKA